MSAIPPQLLVAISGKTVQVRVVGRANFTLSVDLKSLVHEMTEHGFRRFQFDLTDCVLMDSTFLGVLTGIGVQLGEQPADREPGSIELCNASPRVMELFESLGIAHLFSIAQGAPVAADATPVPAHTTASREELAQTCLEAHQTLMAVNPENVAKFKDVARFFEEDLKRLKQAKSA